ncbi:FtsX-like permease family protein [Slackia sp.]|uniref:FtsX-like permease family protein n=1 Tax=Slackia sp. TaxID=2049041 RepID=UPI002E76D1A6|nr:FtsX-like permease family protein [Slackia sp.]MEE0519426.1 FtsX-like permease family protein [Slackia sp.]
MKNAFSKGVLRSITHSLGRFLAIAVIAALGTGFYAGLRMTGPDMRLAADQYFDATHMADLRVVSTLGLSDESLDTLRNVEGVEDVMPAREVDVLATVEDVQYTMRVQSFDAAVARASDTSDGVHAFSDDESYLNRLILTSGSWPEGPNECVLMADVVMDGSVAAGDTVTVLEGTQDVDETLSTREYTVTGFVRSSYYVSPTSLGTTSLGSGALDQVMFVGDEGFAADAPYTEAFISVAGAADEAAGSDAYQAKVDEVAQRIEGCGLAAARLDEVKSEAQKELDQQRADYETQKADAEAQLADGKTELDDAAAQLEDAAAQLSSGQAELDSAAATIAASEKELADGQAAYDTGAAELAAQRASAEAQLASAQAQIDDAQAQYDQAMATREELSSQLSQAQSGLDQVNAAIDANMPAIDQGIERAQRIVDGAKENIDKLDPSDPEYDKKLAALQSWLAFGEQTLSELQGQKDSLLSQQAQLDDAVAQLTAGIAQIDAQTAGVPEQLSAARDELVAQRVTAEEAFATVQSRLDGAASQLISGRSQLDAGKQSYAAGAAELESGKAEYTSGLESYEEGRAEYDEKAADAAAQFADAETKLADAQAEIDALEAPEIMVLDRTKNIGAESFVSDAGRIDRIAMVFPFIFFLVAALVSLTTMTRMVEEERVLVGTYKALGYSKARITSKYLIYAVVASGVGAAIGIVALSLFLPYFIMDAYSIIYAVPVRPAPIDPGLALLSAGLGVGITVAATCFAAASTLRETPAALMLPRAPKAGKRILLERIRPLWSRMSFSWKVTARNIFRYKRRFFMAVIGIAGCTALLLTGLGLQNAINDIIDKQFGEIYHYNMVVREADDVSQEDASAVDGILADAGLESAHAAAHTENMLAARVDDPNGEQQRFELIVPEEPHQFSEYVTMRERVGHDPLSLDGEGVVISEKLANELGLSTGETMLLFDEDAIGNATGEGREVRVSGIMENYVSQYAFATPEAFGKISDEAPAFTTLFVKATEDEAQRAELSDELLAIDGVKTVGFNDETIESYRTMLKSVDAVVVVLVVAAAALAFVVLYNLTNINITERQREIATLKVLGFNTREVNAYIYRETLLLSAIGALVGCVLGIFMEGFVVVTAEVDQVMFGREIHALSFVIAFVLTMLFSVLVTLFMRKKLSDIDMVESLKSVE